MATSLLADVAESRSDLDAENGRLRDEVARLENIIATLQADARLFAAAASNPERQPGDAYHSAFFENSPNDLFVLDVREDGRFVFEQVNPMVTKSTGYTPEMLVGKTPEEALTPANSSRLVARYRQCVESRQRIEYEVTGIAPIGEVVRRTVLVPIVDGSGKVRKILGTSSDLTALRRAEEALLQAQKIEAIGQLTRSLAHDFNNLLMTITGNLEILAARASGELERGWITAALRAAERGADLTSRLLAFARHQPLKPEPVDLNKAVASLANMLRSALGGMIRVEIELMPGAPAALADSKQLDLVLLNLAINSRDAMPNGGTLRIVTEHETVGSPTRPEHPPAGDYAVISVADTGTGIAPELLGRIFEPFFTTKEPGRGSGLGLSQALGFVQQSGGGLRIDSRPRLGTTIRLYLPQAGDLASVAQVTAPPPPAEVSSRRLAVLVVDDDGPVRAVTSTMVQELGHQVIEAESGGAALDILARGAVVDATMIDYAMPAMNGVELAERVRQLRPGIPILFITGVAELDGLRSASASGFVLQKPFKATDLAAKLALIGAATRAS